MATKSHATPAAKGPPGSMHFNGIETSIFVFAGIGNAAGYSNEGAFVHVAEIQGLSSAQPHIGGEEFANEGLLAPSSMVGRAS